MGLLQKRKPKSYTVQNRWKAIQGKLNNNKKAATGEDAAIIHREASFFSSSTYLTKVALRCMRVQGRTRAFSSVT